MKLILKCGLVFMFSCSLISCDWKKDPLLQGTREQPYAPKSKDTLVLSNSAEPDTLDPQKVTGLHEIQILDDLFEGLASVNSDGHLVPGVAESWENQGSKRWIFHLRSSAKWSNGDPVTAKDFVYAWKRLVNPHTASLYASYAVDMHILNAKAIVEGQKDVNQLGVKALDDKTLEVTLEAPLPYLPAMLTHPSVFPLHESSIKSHGDKWTQAGNLVSNGPYKLESWLVNNRVTAVKNNYYWDAPHVKIKKVAYLPITQPTADAVAFMSGNSDITYNALPPEIYPKLKRLYPNELRLGTQLCTSYYEMNHGRRPFNDQRVRLALNLLINRKNITDNILKQGQKPTYTITPAFTNNFAYMEPEWVKWSMAKRVQKAKELLNAAGFNEQHPLRFELLYVNRDINKTVSLALASEWKRYVNFIQVTMANKEWKGYLQARNAGNFDVVKRNWCGDYNEPSSFLNVYRSNSSFTHINYHNPQYDACLDKTLNPSLSDEERKGLYMKCEKVLMDDAALLILHTVVAPRLVKSYVKGYKTDDPQNFVHVKDLELLQQAP